MAQEYSLIQPGTTRKRRNLLYIAIAAFVVLFISLIGVLSINAYNHYYSSSLHYPPSMPVLQPAAPGVSVKQIHSHNDYWRDVPLLRAVSMGIQSVEADVWITNSNGDQTLYVGHNWYSLSSARRFSSMYIDPLVEILDMANTPPPAAPHHPDTSHVHGVFATDTTKTLYLFVDIKTDPVETWEAVVAHLDPLRSKNYLSYYSKDDKDIVWGPVTVLFTGNVPVDLIKPLQYRDYFIDGTLDLETCDSPSLCPIASGDFVRFVGHPQWDGMDPAQLLTASKIVNQSHDQGIMTRFWNVPEWPVAIRDHLWTQFLQIGVDFLNADDLQAAVDF